MARHPPAGGGGPGRAATTARRVFSSGLRRGCTGCRSCWALRPWRRRPGSRKRRAESVSAPSRHAQVLADGLPVADYRQHPHPGSGPLQDASGPLVVRAQAGSDTAMGSGRCGDHERRSLMRYRRPWPFIAGRTFTVLGRSIQTLALWLSRPFSWLLTVSGAPPVMWESRVADMGTKAGDSCTQLRKSPIDPTILPTRVGRPPMLAICAALLQLKEALPVQEWMGCWGRRYETPARLIDPVASASAWDGATGHRGQPATRGFVPQALCHSHASGRSGRRNRAVTWAWRRATG